MSTSKTTTTYIKPDRAMVYASQILQLRGRGLTDEQRRKLYARAGTVRKQLTAYEIKRVKDLLGLA